MERQGQPLERKKTMDQKFSGGVGQVAGRDVKNSNSQANVSIHLHNGENAKRYISDRQRRAIGAKVFELEAKTGVEKLIVYRRLMTRFKFQSMDEMPRDMFERVMRYLDGWIRNGTTEQLPTPATVAAPIRRVIEERIPDSMPQATSAEPSIMPKESAFSPASPSPAALPENQPNRFPWLTVCLAAIAITAIAGTLYVVMNRTTDYALNQSADASRHCEYGGTRYTVGSIVRQDGLRQRCEATPGHAAAWQPLAANGRH